MVSAWGYLLVAALFETGWAIGLEYSDGFTRPLPTALTIVSMIIAVVLLARAVQSLPIGTAYAVWTGIGAAATALLGVVLFSENASVLRFGCIGLIIAGIVGLQLTGH